MELQEAVTQFLFHCRYEKNLSPKTLKAYSIDLRQFTEYLATNLEIATLAAVDKTALRAYIKSLSTTSGSLQWTATLETEIRTKTRWMCPARRRSTVPVCRRVHH